MSVTFNGTTDRLQWNGQLLSAYPFTLFAWIKPTAAGTTQFILDISSNTLSEGTSVLYSAGVPALRSRMLNISTAFNADDDSGDIQTSWNPVIYIATSATDQRCYYRTGTGVPQVSSVNPTWASINRTMIGVAADGSSLPWTGDIAEVWIWSVALTTANFTTLKGDVKPEVAFPSNIVEGWTLEVGSSDQVGFVSRTLTHTGTTTGATHPITRSAATDTLMGQACL